MNVKKPNRTRNTDSDRSQMQQKQSGDQHILPLDAMDEDQHHPHRLSRQSRSLQEGGTGESEETRNAGDETSGNLRH